MAEPLRWGVLGATSRIYRGKLLPPMQASGHHEVVAEASRTADGSDAPYAELLRRADVDAVYIPLPNDGHRPWILAALEAGKHVMCEKPLTMSVAHTDEVFAAAEAAGRVLMEAYMWPHHPRHRAVLDAARTHLGQLRLSQGMFSFLLDRTSDHRFDRRGRGALFDVGIYCLGPALLLAPREPVAVAAAAVCNEHGVDVSFSGWIDLGEGFTAAVDASFESIYRRSLFLVGTHGSISITSDLAPGPTEPSVVQVVHRDDSITEYPVAGANAYGEMIDQFAAVVEGRESAIWGADESRLLARWIEALHTAAGVS
jgi:D-xylose 1-dehydrogenase (NADP+, D-xylono-1,5-lactone-forming)